MTWDQVSNAIDALPNEDDWDGAGSPAPLPLAIDAAYAVANRLRLDDGTLGAPDRVIASVNGEVIFEWHDQDEYRELRISAASVKKGATMAKLSSAVPLEWKQVYFDADNQSGLWNADSAIRHRWWEINGGEQEGYVAQIFWGHWQGFQLDTSPVLQTLSEAKQWCQTQEVESTGWTT